MAKTIRVTDNVHLTLFLGEDGVPMIQITESDHNEDVTLTSDEMNKLVKEYLAQQML